MVNEDGEVIETSLVERPMSGSSLVQFEPKLVLDQAATAAAALKRVLDQKPKKVMMNGEQFIEFEDWQTLGRFYGITAAEDGDPAFVEFGEVKGFKASASAIDLSGNVISRATAYCLSDEEKWGSRNKYAWVYCLAAGGHSAPGDEPPANEMVWVERTDGKLGRDGKIGRIPKKERVLVGTESVPLFQMASMAQTRAAAKVLRNVLSWVVVLAGYKPTPAEELPTEEMPQTAAPRTDPQSAAKSQNGSTQAKQTPPDGAGDSWEPPDPTPVQPETLERLMARMARVGRVWDDAARKACQGYIGRPIAVTEEPKHLREVEAQAIIRKLDEKIAKMPPAPVEPPPEIV